MSETQGAEQKIKDPSTSEIQEIPANSEIEEEHPAVRTIYDPQGDEYKIKEFLGDIMDPQNCQVFRAEYRDFKHSDGAVILVALKVAPVKLNSREHGSMKAMADLSSQKIEKHGDFGDNSKDITVRINTSFYTQNVGPRFYCISMPYFPNGSMRYLLSKNPFRRTLPEDCIAVVLREVLHGLCYLERQGKDTFGTLNAGHIFVNNNPVTIQLGYFGSTYYHNPQIRCEVNVWDHEWASSNDSDVKCPVSASEENVFWAKLQTYEPSRSYGPVYSREADIWHLGVTALEMAFGPLDRYDPVNLRDRGQICSFLEIFEAIGGNLPTLRELLLDEKTTVGVGRSSSLRDLFIDEGGSSSTSHVGDEVKKKKENEDQITAKARKLNLKKVKTGVRYAVQETKEFAAKLRGLIHKPRKDPVTRKAKQFSDAFETMVKKCLLVDPKKRPTAQQLLKDPFFKMHKNVDLKIIAEVLGDVMNN